MANSIKPSDETQRKSFTAAVKLFTKTGEQRAPGETVYEDELPAATSAQELVEMGALVDTDKPVAPSAASKALAHRMYAEDAIAARVVEFDGKVYTFGKTKVTGGLEKFLEQVALDDLRAALIEAAKAKK